MRPKTFSTLLLALLSGCSTALANPEFDNGPTILGDGSYAAISRKPEVERIVKTRGANVQLDKRQSTNNPQEFCRWWGQQSLVLGNKIYVDGGIRTFRETYEEGYLYVYYSISNLDFSKGLTFPIKQSSREWFTGVAANTQGEATQQGAIFTDGGNSIYKYGGWFADNNTWTKSAQVQIREAQLWRYDMQNSKWELDQLRGDTINRAYGGAYVSVPEKKKAYYIGGIIGPTTDSAFRTWLGHEILENSFLQFDTGKVTWKNATTASVGPVGLANVVHIPQMGKEGVLVLLGGVTAPQGTIINRSNERDVMQVRPLDLIHVFDIATNKWYSQKTSGDTPPSRLSSCAVVVPSKDGTSWNVVIYAGAVTNTNAIFGDVWVLSLPSFQWVKMDDMGEKKFMHQCHLIKKSKMVVIGGKDLKQESQGNPAANYTTTPSQWSCDPLGFVSALDLNTFTWMKDGVPEVEEEFKVHQDIIAKIGGTENGNATKLGPIDGWDDSALGSIMYVKENNPTNSPSPDDSGDSGDDKAPIGAIVGGAVGGVIALALIAIGVFFYLRKRKNEQNKKAPEATGMLAPPGGAPPPPMSPYQQDPRQSMMYGAGQQTPASYWSPPPNPEQQAAYFQQQAQGGYYPQQMMQQQPYPFGVMQPPVAIAEVSGDSYYAPPKAEQSPHTSPVMQPQPYMGQQTPVTPQGQTVSELPVNNPQQQ